MTLNKPMIIAISLCIATGLVFADVEFPQANGVPLSTVTYRVEDQAGIAVSNAFVRTGCGKEICGLTDANGLYTYRDRIWDAIGGIVSKEGYYRTRGEAWPVPQLAKPPTKPLVIVLKKIINPVPLWSKRIEATPPRLGESIGFDLEVGDWVAPDGKGHISDIWFNAEKRMASWSDFVFTVTTTFSTNGIDGIQAFMAPDPAGMALASDLMPPQEAPMNGYTNSLVASLQMRPGPSPRDADSVVDTFTKNKNYIFRVRGRKNDKGEIVAANVGWIRGDFKVDGRDYKAQNGVILFNYYYNPDPHSKSLEDKGQADWEEKENAKLGKEQ